MLVNIGGSASATSARNVGQKPSPKPRLMLTGSASATMANEGIARPMFTSDTAKNPPLPMCPSASAGGTAIAAATAIENAES